MMVVVDLIYVFGHRRDSAKGTFGTSCGKGGRAVVGSKAKGEKEENDDDDDNYVDANAKQHCSSS